jgi:hypothetical protein
MKHVQRVCDICRYYKRIEVPEAAAMGFKLSPSNLKWQHAFNTLVVSYSKPDEVRKAESMDKRSLSSITQQQEPGDCKQQ